MNHSGSCPEGQVSAWMYDGSWCLPKPRPHGGFPIPPVDTSKLAPVDPLPQASQNGMDVVVVPTTTPTYYDDD